ncbi:MAG: hypothetical protein H6985_08965 [Pseudomonadales bacterium]|nr:hypothetical protein [Pseudomonadales bacterium]
MDIKDFSQAMAVQKELAASLKSNIEKLAPGRTSSLADTVAEQQALVDQARTDLATCEREQALSAKHWDLKVQQRRELLQSLDSGLKEMREKVAALEKANKTTPAGTGTVSGGARPAAEKAKVTTTAKTRAKAGLSAKAKAKTTVTRKDS